VAAGLHNESGLDRISGEERSHRHDVTGHASAGKLRIEMDPGVEGSSISTDNSATANLCMVLIEGARYGLK
jgi:hypothetical protein